MQKPPIGAILVATAASVAALATWTLRPAPNAVDNDGRARDTTSASVALAPEVLRHDVHVRREVARIEAAPRPMALTREPEERTVETADPDAAARATLAVQLEREASAALRAIARAQQQLQASAIIDTDGDGAGEYGYVGELMGASPLRKFVRGEGARAGHTGEVLDPPLLPTDFGVFSIVGAHGAVQRGAYYFQVHLPSASAEAPVGASEAAPVGALPESAGGGADHVSLPGAANAERSWSCYAWPVDEHEAPLRTFFVNHEGTVLVCEDTRNGYSGAKAPRFDAALSDAVAGDMRQPLGLVSLGNRANDGRVWSLAAN